MLTRFLIIVAALLLAGSTLPGCSFQSKGSSSGSSANRPQPTPQAIEQAQSLARRGTELKSDGFTAQALQAFTQAVETNPALTEAHLGIGDIYRELADYAKADRAYRRAVISDRNNFDARYYLGLTNQLRGRLSEAIGSYERALRIDPNSYLANREMATALLQSNRPNESVLFAKRAVELNPRSRPAWANLAAAYSLIGDYRQAVDAYRQTLELGEAQQQVLIGLANAHIKLGNFRLAENVLLEALRKGDSPLARERMALVLFKLRKYEQAVEAYRSVLAGNPSDTAALNGLGVSLMSIYLRDGENDDASRMEALGLWRRSLALRPEQRFLIDLIARYTKE